MIPAPFIAADESIESLERFLDIFTPNAAPILIHHPPSHRSTLASSINNDLLTLDDYFAETGKLIDKLSHMRERLRRQRAVCAGALTPIAALPVDLLREVFQLVVDTSSQTASALSNACGSWRSIISAQPSLWTSIGVKAGESCRSVTPHRIHGASLPLHLAVDDVPDWPYRLKKAFPDAETRLQSLYWSSSADLSSFLYSHWDEPVPFSALHTLKLLFPEYCATCGTHLSSLDDPPFYDVLEAAQLPSLRFLEVSRLDVRLPKDFLPQLEILKLDCDSIRLKTFRDIVQYGRSLKSLAISAVSVLSIWTNSNEDWNETFVLSQLEILKLPLYPTHFVKALLKNCVCPALQTLEFEGASSSPLAVYQNPTIIEQISAFVSPHWFRPRHHLFLMQIKLTNYSN
ncbi:hypothetical protein DL93DRAFT_294019 [Clavulina sp. PMI_390]|nr:hypothetical protein DL93DRAFT_294019 [Clavulina sp. PMI_390]